MNRYALLFLASFAAPAIAADSTSGATGSFRSGEILMEVKSAVAFRGKSLFDDDRAIIVAISNAKMNSDTIADYVDRRRAIEQRVVDPKTGVVWLEFRPDGRFRGISYYFGQGNGCAFCSGEVASTVKVGDGRLAGTLTDREKDRSFDVTLATPIMSDEHGTALPADGGDPGQAYLRYHEALAKGDRATLRPLLSNDQQQFLNDAEKHGQLSSALHAMAETHPTKAVRITGGYATAGKAIVLFVGDSPSTKVAGEALLLKEGGTWRVDDEITAPQP